MEQSNSKRSAEEDTQDSQDGDDQLPCIKKFKLDNEDLEDKDKKEPTISDKYNSDDADITLISSDNVAFKVHSYQLMAASTVFRSMLSIPIPTAKRDAIHLTDVMLEYSGVLEALLGIVYELDMGSVADDGLEWACLVLRLAEKWDFTHVRTLISGAVLQNIHHGYTSVEDDFALSLELKNPKLASIALSEHFNACWMKKDEDVHWEDLPFSIDDVRRRYHEVSPNLNSFAEGLIDARVFELGTWGYDRFLQLPPTDVWALLRALHVGTTKKAQYDVDKVSEEFERLLTLAYEPKKKAVVKG